MNTKIQMHKRDYQRMNKAKPGTKIHCDTGVLWVTRAGDARDYILQSGDEMDVGKRGKVLVEAMREAEFHVV